MHIDEAKNVRAPTRELEGTSPRIGPFFPGTLSINPTQPHGMRHTGADGSASKYQTLACTRSPRHCVAHSRHLAALTRSYRASDEHPLILTTLCTVFTGGKMFEMWKIQRIHDSLSLPRQSCGPNFFRICLHFPRLRIFQHIAWLAARSLASALFCTPRSFVHMSARFCNMLVLLSLYHLDLTVWYENGSQFCVLALDKANSWSHLFGRFSFTIPSAHT